MGIEGLWPFLNKKGYEAEVLDGRYILSSHLQNGSKLHVDIQGTHFSTIRQAYSFHDMDTAHSIVEREIQKFATPTNSALYLDGTPCQEKDLTHQRRQNNRMKALKLVESDIDVLKVRVKEKLRVRKQLFFRLKKNLAKGFYWTFEARQAFAAYLQQRGWSVEVCPTEADLKIAQDCLPGDVVLSRDSDMLLYQHISIIWRPISRGRILAYNVPDVLTTLGINRTQLIVLGVVSSNDYNANVPSLGCVTNFSIIKQLKGEDPAEMVQEYLSNSRVILKNDKKLTFATSLQVFVHHKQTPLQHVQQAQSHQMLQYEELWSTFRRLQIECIDNGKERRDNIQARKRETHDNESQRHKSSQTFNRYRTIDRPEHPPSTHPQPAATPPLLTLTQLTEAPSPSTFPQPAVAPTSSTLHQAVSQQEKPRHRPRYSMKVRTRKIQHDLPESMTQYQWKPWKTTPMAPSAPVIPPQNTTQPEPATAKKVKSVDEMNKADFTRALDWEHPTVTLDVGTLSANVRRAEDLSPDEASEVLRCLREAIRLAADTKRTCQQLLGRFIERVSDPAIFKETDRDLLDLICPRIPGTNKDNDGDKDSDKDDDKDGDKDGEEQEDIDSEIDKEQEDRDADSEVDKDDHQRFLGILTTYVYSGIIPSGKTKSIQCTRRFIDRAQELHLLERKDAAIINTRMPYPGSVILRSIIAQLSVDLKRLYGKGCKELHKKLKKQLVKGLLPAGTCIDIRGDVSAVENFYRLNPLTKNPRKLMACTPSAQPFVAFTELELISIFWKSDTLKAKLQSLHGAKDYRPALSDMSYWLANQAPGYLLTTLITDVGLGHKKRRMPGISKSFNNLATPSLAEIKEHLRIIQNEDFDPRTYKERGYVIRGSIRTDGFRLQLTAFKLKELLSVRYRRHPTDILPSRITSTVGGVDYYLTEVRNVVKTKQDVAVLWDCEPEKIKILGLDLGQAFVVGASALLPEKTLDDMKKSVSLENGKPRNDSYNPEQACVTGASMPRSKESFHQQNSAVGTEQPDNDNDTEASARSSQVFYNLAVKQKAVYQPTFKFRRWLEERKRSIPLGAAKSISNIESELPALRGKDASVEKYVAGLAGVKEQLHEFYNKSATFKKHQWDARKAREAEFDIIADRLLNMVGGSLGRQRDEEDKVVIGIGLGKFSSTGRLSSLHESFQSYFVQRARALGYIVVGVNEYYTSKKCPMCEEFVGQVQIRRLYCKTCKTYMHRDIMAGHNICNVIQGHLLQQQRPLYLQPVDENGRYPWMEATQTVTDSASTSSSSINSNSSTSSINGNSSTSSINGNSSTSSTNSTSSTSSTSASKGSVARKRTASTAAAEQEGAPRRKRAANAASGQESATSQAPGSA